MNYIKATASIVFQKSSSGLAFAFALILNSKDFKLRHPDLTQVEILYQFQMQLK